MFASVRTLCIRCGVPTSNRVTTMSSVEPGLVCQSSSNRLTEFLAVGWKPEWFFGLSNEDDSNSCLLNVYSGEKLCEAEMITSTNVGGSILPFDGVPKSCLHCTYPSISVQYV